jgi:hypothetical protein
MVGVLAEYRSQVPLVVDQHPIGALGPCGAHPPLGVTVRPWRPRRSLHDRHTPESEDLIEDAGELGVTVADKESE